MTSGLHALKPSEVHALVARFDERYARQWDDWLRIEAGDRPLRLGVVLRSWQACRPNRMRRTAQEAAHDRPFIEDLVCEARPFLEQLGDFDIRSAHLLEPSVSEALVALWGVFEDLSYAGTCRNGKAGVVGISKAILLLTDGRVGPAFDSVVRRNVGIRRIDSPTQWLESLSAVAEDINLLEARTGRQLREMVPRRYRSLHLGRLYDMALGP